MRKGLFLLLISVIMLFVLVACNTEQGLEDGQNNNLEDVSFGPADQGIQPFQMPDQDAPGNRFDANIPNEGLPQGDVNENRQQPNVYERADRYAQGDDHLGSNKERVDQVNGSFKQEVVRLTNKARKNNGLPPLKISEDVMNVAQKKSQDMAKHEYFSHTSPTYGSPFDMLKQFGVEYRTAAENIAAGQQTPEKVVNGWLNSSGHRKNIMNKNLTHIGVGFAEDGQYWTQMFIGKK